MGRRRMNYPDSDDYAGQARYHANEARREHARARQALADAERYDTRALSYRSMARQAARRGRQGEAARWGQAAMTWFRIADNERRWAWSRRKAGRWATGHAAKWRRMHREREARWRRLRAERADNLVAAELAGVDLDAATATAEAR